MRAILSLGLVLFLGCGHSEPYQDLRVEPEKGAILVAQHSVGFEVVPGRLSRLLHGAKVPQTSWILRVWADGRVERDQIPRCQWQTVKLPRIAPAQVQRLVEAAQLVAGGPSLLGPTQIEDASRNSLTVQHAGAIVTIIRTRGDTSEDSADTKRFDSFWAILEREFPPPLSESVAGCH